MSIYIHFPEIATHFPASTFLLRADRAFYITTYFLTTCMTTTRRQKPPTRSLMYARFDIQYICCEERHNMHKTL